MNEDERRTYKLVSALGHGGFGSVFRGQLAGSSGFAKTVAIKLLNEEAANVEEYKCRLRDEARLLGLLRHRAIVHVEDLVRIDGRWAVVMEFVEGADLKALLELGPIPPRTACEIVHEIAAALQVAHDARDRESGAPLEIVHRDIKPANIRITPSGEVKVLDFGVARAAFDDREAKTNSMSFGSMGYLSPERFDGTDTRAADVYALGVVAYEAFSGESMGQLSVNVNKHDPELARRLGALSQQLGSSFGKDITSCLRRMLAYDYEDRPESEEVADRFQELMIEADGPFLKKWIPKALEAVEQEELAIASKQMECVPVSDEHSLKREPGTSNDRPLSPDSGNSLAKQKPRKSTARIGRKGVAPLSPVPEGPPRKDGRARSGGSSPATGKSGPRIMAPADTRPRSGGAGSSGEPDLGPARKKPWWPAAALAVLALAVVLVLMSWPDPEPTEAEDAPTPESSGSRADTTSEQQRKEAPRVASSNMAPERGTAAERLPAETEAETRDETTAAETGTVRIDGNIIGARIIAADGTAHSVGELPVGTYDLQVAFPGGVSVAHADLVKIRSGETTVLFCSDETQNCQ